MRYTINSNLEYEARINKSHFIGSIGHISTSEGAKIFIQERSKLHNQAAHHCPAYILGDRGEICFSSDNQEPCGTAGKPILNMLLRYELTNNIIVVTRYYGGVKLGVRGLIEAYSSVAEGVIQLGIKEPIIKSVIYIIEMSYNYYDSFVHQFTDPNITFLGVDFQEIIVIRMEVKETYIKDIRSELYVLEVQRRIKIRECNA